MPKQFDDYGSTEQAAIDDEVARLLGQLAPAEIKPGDDEATRKSIAAQPQFVAQLVTERQARLAKSR